MCRYLDDPMVLGSPVEEQAMEWLGGSITGVYWIAAAMAGAAALVRWLTRCRHPNPHFQHAVVEPDPATGNPIVVEPAQYYCYECGKTWPARLRDPAWAPTAVVQKFAGYDEDKAIQSARRASRAQDRRRALAAGRSRRAGFSEPLGIAQRKRKRPANVVDMHTRKPA